MELVMTWHESTDYISQVTGHTRLDGHQLSELHTAITLDPVWTFARTRDGHLLDY